MPGKLHNPDYQAATASQPAGQHTLSGTYGAFRKNNSLSSLLISLLILQAMLSLFTIIAYQIIPPEALKQTANQTANQISSILHWSGTAQIVLGIFIVIIFCIWINRSCKNAWLLNPPKMKITPGWAAGYYFIPVLCLWKPYASMNEIRDASYGRHHKLAALLPLWWSCLIAFIILSASSQLLIYTGTDQQTLSTAHKLGVVAAPVNIILNYLTIAVVAAVTLEQNKRASEWRT